MTNSSSEATYILRDLFRLLYDCVQGSCQELPRNTFIDEWVKVWTGNTEISPLFRQKIAENRSELLSFIEKTAGEKRYDQKTCKRLKKIVENWSDLHDVDYYFSSQPTSEKAKMTENPPSISVENTPALSLLWVKRKTGGKTKPKTENFHTKHLRGMKNVLRKLEKWFQQLENGFGQLENGIKPPKKCIHAVTNRTAAQLWQTLQSIYERYRDSLSYIGNTANGPKNDGKNKRKTAPRSYNAEYCRGLFQERGVGEFYFLYIDMVYSDEPEQMCQKMNMLCCGGHHIGRCKEVWERVKEYAKRGIMKDVGCESLPENS